jgi:cell division septum initiation protein DivIVA
MGLGSERDLVPLGAGFDIVKRGYSRTQVEEHLERLDSDLRLIAADRDAAMSQAADLARQMERARHDLDDLRGQVNRLSLPPTSLEGLSERLQRMLKLAQEEASDTRARAETDAVHVRSRAEADGAALRNRYQNLIAEVDGRRVELETEHRELVEKSQADFATRIKQAEDERVKADADAEARRNQIDEDFEIAMAARRTEAMKALATQEATSKGEAERRVREATEEANRIQAQVNEEATHLRAQLAEQERSSKAESEQRVREATEEAARIRAMVAEEQRTSKAEAERRVREATEEANRRRHDALTEAQARLQDAADEANRRVREATEEATRRTNHAHGQVEALRTLRIQIAEQLRAATTLITNATPALEPLPEEQAALQSGLVGADADHTWPVADARTQETTPAAAAATPAAPAKDAKAAANPHAQATTTQAIANAPTRRTNPVNQPKPAAQQPAAQPTRPGNNVRRSEPSTKR